MHRCQNWPMHHAWVPLVMSAKFSSDHFTFMEMNSARKLQFEPESNFIARYCRLL